MLSVELAGGITPLTANEEGSTAGLNESGETLVL
jgi:hypothetical protein